MTKEFEPTHSHPVRRNFKDGLFRLLFSNKDGALELYNALNNSSYTDPDLLEITTIDGAIYMGIKNDLAFLVEGQMHLLEAQSSWSPNMPLRGLFYFSGLYQGYVAKNQLDIYSYKRLSLPKPVYIVFYNGVDEFPEQTELRLSDSFESSDENPAVEVIARIYNINYGRNQQLMERCQRLHGYAYLIQRVRNYTNNGLLLEAAIDCAVKDCIQKNILKPFLLKHRGEVCNMILTEYDHEFHVRCEKKLSFEDGERSGIQQGLQQGLQQSIFILIQDNLEENISTDRILQKLQKHYRITPSEAENYMAEYQATQKNRI